ncbi:SEC14 family lipid-binding protein [Bacteriovoracaceae bacterium]|nr:SEC14 family lipid-binding protein [Bacteriovoracaceae bacterium]
MKYLLLILFWSFQCQAALEKIKLLLPTDRTIYESTIYHFGGEETFLRRFYEGNGKNIEKTVDAILATLDFREKYQLFEKEVTYSDIEQEISSSWCSRYPGYSLDGHAIGYTQLSRLNPKELLSKYSEDQIEQFYVKWLEIGLALQRGTEIDGVYEVYDLKGLGIRQFSKTNINLVKKLISIALKHYPEHLAIGSIVNMPRVGRIAWGLVSKILDSDTKLKIRMIDREVESNLIDLFGSEQKYRDVMKSMNSEPNLYQ